MNRDERYILRKMLIPMILQADGQAYQDLFVLIMTKSDPSFRPIRPHGKKGDGKNDGYVRDSGSYYQCYAPEKINCKEAITKIKSSYEGLKTVWSPTKGVNKFFFVLNDRYKGCYPDIENTLAQLQEQDDVECLPFLCKDLEDIALTLNDDALIDIVGLPPSPSNIGNIDYTVLSEVIQILQTKSQTTLKEESYPNVDFERKIDFNTISEPVANILRQANFQVGDLEEYLSNSSAFANNDLQTIFINEYKNSALAFQGINKNVSDLVILNMLQSIVSGRSSTYRDATLVMMSYYFEVCDILETPPS